MSVTITLAHLGFADNDAELSRRIEQIFESYEGDWKVKIIGDQMNTIWVMTITNPQGNNIFLKKLYSEDGSHQVQRIVEYIDNTMRDEKKKE